MCHGLKLLICFRLGTELLQQSNADLQRQLLEAREEHKTSVSDCLELRDECHQLDSEVQVSLSSMFSMLIDE